MDIMRHKRDIQALSADVKERLAREYKSVFSQPIWVFRRESKRKVRSYTTSDFEREYFIPDL